MEKLTETIVNLIPSKALKAEIAKQRTVFKDRDLIALIYQHAPTIKESIELFQQLKPYVKSDKDVKLIDKIIKLRNSQIKKFTAPTKNCIYKVDVCCSSGSQDTFYNKRYDTIVDNLKYWLQKYADVMTDDSVSDIVVTKEYVFDKMDDATMKKADKCGYCHLSPDFEISRISVDRYSRLEEMMDFYRMRLPTFINKYDLVSYVDGGVKHYGIVAFDMKEVSYKDDIAVDELDQPIATYRRFFDETTVYDNRIYYDFFGGHHHIKFTALEKENVEDAPSQIQSNYAYIKECFIKVFG